MKREGYESAAMRRISRVQPTRPYKANRRFPLGVKGMLIWDSIHAGTYRKPEAIERQNARVRSVRGSTP